MVSLVKDDVTIELSKLTYSLKGRIGGYLNDNIDRSKMKLYILLNTKSLLGVTISTTLTGKKCYKVEMDCKSAKEEKDIDLDEVYKNVTNFHKNNSEVTKILLDDDYKVFGIGDAKNDYHPYELNNRNLLEATLNNSYPIIDAVNKTTDEYFICAFPDILFTVDKHSTLNFISILIKNYVEIRFPVIDKNKLEENQIISFPTFCLLVFYLKNILKASCNTSYSIKNYFDNMSKMNLLPHVPSKNWFIESCELKLETNRLLDFLTKKESLIEKIKGKALDNKDDDKDDNLKISSFNIPEYFSGEFMDDTLQSMSWNRFLYEFNKYEEDLENKSVKTSFVPIIITPTENISTVKKEDIIFLGFNDEHFFMSINSKNPSGNIETSKEINLRETLRSFFWIRFGYDVTVVYDSIINETINDTRFDSLDYYMGE